MSGKDGEPILGSMSRIFWFSIIDECHRGGANDESNWRNILNYFSGAVHLGLTATPNLKDNTDTYAYFGKPVFIYSLKEGIQDGFLTPFKVKRIQTTIDEYIYTPDDEVIEGEVDEGHVYTEKDFNKTIVIKEREKKRVEDMLAAINQMKRHWCSALTKPMQEWWDLINQTADSPSVDYCVRVTANDGDIGDNYLNQFKDNDKTIPTILTTSQKLTTGVDARNVRNIVLMRPVNSMIEFKQIIGRGTRLFEGKHYFTIIDFVNAYHMFNDAEWDGEPVEPEGSGGNDGTGGTGNGGDSGDGGDGGEGDPPKTKLKIKLSDGKCVFQSMIAPFMLTATNQCWRVSKRLFDVLNYQNCWKVKNDCVNCGQIQWHAGNYWKSWKM